jgi:tetratricopeptide (TPR) repeat protein
LGRHEEAEREYCRAIELDPHLPNPHYGLGNLLQYELMRYEEAEREYRRAIELDPQFAPAWGNLGDLLQERARYDEAAEAYRRAIGLDSKSPPWSRLGYLLDVHMGRSEEAEQAYREAIEQNPSDTASWNNLGTVLRDLERLVEAEQAYRQCLQLDPQSVYAWSNLGSLLQLSPGREREAGTALLRAFELDRDRTWDLEMFARVCHRLADSPDEAPAALELAQGAHQLAPDDPETQFLLARALTLTSNWPAAAALLEQLAATESTSYSTDFFRTVVKTGNLDGALTILEQNGANERWRPLYEALRAARAGTPRFLRTVAPEVRVAAIEILRDLDPNLFATGDGLDS